MTLPSFSVENKVTLVTGAGRGIGQALALGFGEAGSPVAVVARTVSELEETAECVRRIGGKALVVGADLTQKDQVRGMVETVVREYGRIDVLLNVAGGAGDLYVLPALEMAESHYDELQDRNLKSVFLCNQAVASAMVRQRTGSIINISSLSGTKPVAYEAAVGAFKAGVNQLTRALAVSWAPYNIRVNAIAPGLTLTARVKKKLIPEFIEQYSRGIPLGRAATPQDHLGLALFLASDASAYITGAVIPSDGGPQ